VSGPVQHPHQQATGSGTCEPCGITGSSALKGHVAMDPDATIDTETKVTPGNAGDAGDASVAEDLVADLLDGTAAVLDDPAAGRPTPPDPGASTGSNRYASQPWRRQLP